MKIGPLEVMLETEHSQCDTCLNEAALVIDSQPQCSFHAGEKLQAEPEALAVLLELALAK